MSEKIFVEEKESELLTRRPNSNLMRMKLTPGSTVTEEVDEPGFGKTVVVFDSAVLSDIRRKRLEIYAPAEQEAVIINTNLFGVKKAHADERKLYGQVLMSDSGGESFFLADGLKDFVPVLHSVEFTCRQSEPEPAAIPVYNTAYAESQVKYTWMFRDVLLLPEGIHLNSMWNLADLGDMHQLHPETSAQLLLQVLRFYSEYERLYADESLNPYVPHFNQEDFWVDLHSGRVVLMNTRQEASTPLAVIREIWAFFHRWTGDAFSSHAEPGNKNWARYEEFLDTMVNIDKPSILMADYLRSLRSTMRGWIWDADAEDDDFEFTFKFEDEYFPIWREMNDRLISFPKEMEQLGDVKLPEYEFDKVPLKELYSLNAGTVAMIVRLAMGMHIISDNIATRLRDIWHETWENAPQDYNPLSGYLVMLEKFSKEYANCLSPAGIPMKYRHDSACLELAEELADLVTETTVSLMKALTLWKQGKVPTGEFVQAARVLNDRISSHWNRALPMAVSLMVKEIRAVLLAVTVNQAISNLFAPDSDAWGSPSNILRLWDSMPWLVMATLELPERADAGKDVEEYIKALYWQAQMISQSSEDGLDETSK